MTDTITACIQELRTKRDDLAAEAAAIDETIASLERVAGDAPPPLRQPKNPRAKKATAVAEHKPAPAPSPPEPTEEAEPPQRRVQWKRRPWFAAWRDELLAKALALPRASLDRRDALRAIVAAEHTLPDGTTARVPSSLLYAWVAELDVDQDEDAKHTTGPKRRRGIGTRSATPDELAELDQRERLQQEGIIGNPLQLAKGFDDPGRRRPECPAYKNCLTYAARKKWQAFTCDACSGPGVQDLGGKPGARKGAA